MARQWPLPEGTYRITSRFAGRNNPVTGRPENHSGTDLAAPDGTPFYACAGGTIKYLGAASGYGQWIVVDSPDADGGGCWEYGHMWNAHATGLRIGHRVESGQLLGYIGSNGQSTGPHLHVTVWKREYGGQRIDPETALAGAPHVPNGGGKAAGASAPKQSTGGTVGTIFGPDVSYFQNGMSLAAAKREGCQFVILRTNDGTFKDTCYASHYDDAKSAGLLIAAYAFVRNPSEGSTIAQQVQTTISVLGNRRVPVWLDCETNAGLHVDHIREYKRRLEAAGVRVPGIYTYVPFWEGKVSPSEPDMGEFGYLWKAAYPGGAGTAAQVYSASGGDGSRNWTYPLGNRKPDLWQFTDRASIAGYQVDCNAFKGTEAELRAIFYGGSAATPKGDTLSAQAEKRIELALDQLVGFKKNDNGLPTFEGWNLAETLDRARQKKFANLTLVELLVLNVAGTENDLKAARAAANGGK